MAGERRGDLVVIGFPDPEGARVLNVSIDLAVRTIKEGAEQFLTKPVDLDRFDRTLERLSARLTSRRSSSACAAVKPPSAAAHRAGSSSVRQAS